MSVAIFSRFVSFGYKYKVCPFQLTLKKSTSTWKLEQSQQEIKAYKLVNSIGCFLLFVTSINMLVQIINDFRRPLHLAMDLGLFIMLTFCAYAQSLSLSNPGFVKFMNSFFQCIPRGGKSEFLNRHLVKIIRNLISPQSSKSYLLSFWFISDKTF